MRGALGRSARCVMCAGALAALVASGCALDVERRESTRTVRLRTPALDLPVYPRAKAVAARFSVPPAVSFTGRFADTAAHSSHFATDDGVDLVLRFYRDAVRKRGESLECRGTINVRAHGRTEDLRCVRGASESVQLAVSPVPGHHAVVSVTPAVTGSTFTLVNVRTKH